MADDDPTRQVDPDDKSTRRADPDDFATVRGLSVGRKVFGRYVLEAKLGAGGMGVVWRARDVELEEQVALKFLPEVVARDEAAVSELKIETRHARRLTHPNIVRIHQFEREGAMAAVSMEFVDGMTLTKLRLAQPGEVFAVEALAPLVAQLCAALDYAHAQAKIVHRDLKPANILVTRDSAVKVADFGIARSLSDTHTRLTGRADNTSGTLVYMSPQQLSGEDPVASDDIYALGATLYELLTAKPPFHTGDIGLQIRETAPKPVNQRRTASGSAPVPAAWEETILACLAKEPEDRPQSAGEMVRRLSLTEAIGSDSGRAAIARAETLPCQVSETAPPKIHDIAPAPTGRSRPASGSEMVGSETGSHQDSKRGSRTALIAVLVPLAFSIFLIYLFRPKIEPALGINNAKSSITEPVTAFDETKAKAESGDANAQCDLGKKYANGEGVTKDSAEAAKWYRKAADQGFAKAQCNLGVMYVTGDGVLKDSANARTWFRLAADQGYAIAQKNLGLLYADGDGVPKDSAEAVKWFSKAAAQGNAAARNDLGWMYANGEGVTKNESEALAWYRKAADQGNAVAQNHLGLMFANGNGVPKDSAEAAQWYRKAADQGNPDGQMNLGWLYSTGEGVPKDIAEALKWFRKAADNGNALAQDDLGRMYANGEGMTKDSTEAARWYRKAADQGYADAQDNLGWLYHTGNGVTKDDTEAVQWFRKAADQGDAVAQKNLGLMYVDGEGVGKDSVEAIKFFRKAVEQGNAEAQGSLGWMYANGDGVAKDNLEAAKWYRMAAEQGNSNSQWLLGAIYEAGDGVPKDEIEALSWYETAAVSGNDSAVKLRDALKLRLSPQRNLAAQQRSNEIIKRIESVKARQYDSHAIKGIRKD